MEKKNSAVFAGIIFVVMVVLIGIVSAGGAFSFEGTFWALVPPLVAIVLALITKEAYSSLFVGVVLGALMASGVSFTGTLNLVTVE